MVSIEALPERRGGKIQPQDLDAERSVLGGLLLDGAAVSEAVGVLRPEDFYRPSHAHVFEAMAALFERGDPIDEITVSAQLKSQGRLEAAGGSAQVASLADAVPTAANVIHYAHIVRDRALSRRLISAATAIASSGYEGTTDIDALLDQAEAKIFEITSSRELRGFVSLKEVLKGTISHLEQLHNRRGAITGVPSGYADLDRLTSGFQPSDLIIVAGRPSMGKTALALNVAGHVALQQRIPVAMFSLEMSKEQLVTRMLCSEARLDSQRVRRGTLQDTEWPRLGRFAGILAEAPLFIDDSGTLSVLEMRSKARRLQAEKGLGLVVVDYLQLMRGRTAQDGREREISEISRGLKALAKELQVPVIALSQLNRSLEQRQDKRPMLSDLRESGAIEQDADVICFVYRDEYYNPNGSEKGLAELIVGKQRNGPTGLVKLKYFKEYTRFENSAQERGSEG